MATITFLSPRRGSGTTTAVAAAASALTQSCVQVHIIDRTTNEDFSRWWPTPPPTPERIDSTLTLIDAHEPRPQDTLVLVVYDALTEPNPSLWLSALVAEHPHLVIIGAIINRTNESPGTLDVPGRPTVRVKPLPHHHLLHDAALQHRWPLEISALSQQHVRIPTMALSPHIAVAVSAAAQFPPLPTPNPVDDADPLNAETHPSPAQITDQPEQSPVLDTPQPTALTDLDDIDDDHEPTSRKGYSVPTQYKKAMLTLDVPGRRRMLSSMVDTHLPNVTPYPADSDVKRARLDSAWAQSDTNAITAAAKRHRCKEWQIVSALLAAQFTS